jgi:HEAT repeat protein
MSLNLQKVLDKICARDLKTILEGLEEIHQHQMEFSRENLFLIADTLGSLFFIDNFDRPDLEPGVERAIEVMAEIGPDIISYIVETFENSDIKANICFARVLGKIGVPALPHILELYRKSDDSYRKSYALYALGKIKDRAVLAALPDISEALDSSELEVQDTAIRTLGKLCGLITSRDLSTYQREHLFSKLFINLSHHAPTIRAKSVRTLGKMYLSGFLNDEQKDSLRKACLRIVGQDENFEWDRSYIVRKESTEILNEMKLRGEHKNE